ncbi:mechanosensitive ion channel family protein [Halobaculum sp. CBA1158]|uniref:mechanosensitive ion channel domain-containing protein n=1 Tax=Halobaculum sp. CBA1158 TaxID=2904243 RepID=UPI001F334E35|nr:mechanosensitive ion channel domain-containing protein [Halobaculum sp. CBA1158]UIP01271.1 mechanosensitive ion channel family protein [Halobaculum sp. CBA1158]
MASATTGVPLQSPGGLVESALTSITARLWLALGVILFAAFLGYLVVRVNRRILESAGVPETIEGTAFERTAHEFGTSTVSLVANLSGYFIFILGVIVALTIARVQYISTFWNRTAGFLPSLFLAVLVLIVGLVVGDKVELLVDDRLSGVKLPQTAVVPALAKWSVVFVAVLVALGQVGVNTGALVVLLGTYGFGLVLFGGLAFRDLLASGAAGFYLLLEQPYSIGDRVRIGDTDGIVQEVNVFVTHVENDGAEYIVPNRRAFTEGIVRIRE